MAMPPAVQEQTTALDKPRPILPQNMESALAFCEVIAESGIVPNHYLQAKNPQAALFAALQLGAEVGLSPMASIQSIYIVNGYPKIWGESALALCRQSGKMEYFREWSDGKDLQYTAYCETKRVDDDFPVKQQYSLEDAEFAGLLSKSGPWHTDPKRMCQWRARQRCLSDAFPDVLKGLARNISTGEDDDAPLTGPDKAKPVVAQNATDFNAAIKQQHADKAPNFHAEPKPTDADFTVADEIEQPEVQEEADEPDEAAFKQWFDDTINTCQRKRSPNTLADYIQEIQPQIDKWRNDFPDEISEFEDAVRAKMAELKPEPSAPPETEDGAEQSPTHAPTNSAPSSPLPEGAPEWAVDFLERAAKQTTPDAIEELRKGYGSQLSNIAFSDDPIAKEVFPIICNEIKRLKEALKNG